MKRSEINKALKELEAMCAESQVLSAAVLRLHPGAVEAHRP